MSQTPMFICRLFNRERPFEQVEARLLAEGSMTIGRGATADWSVEDPTGALSRLHCTLAVEDGRLLLYDNSTNGTFLEGGERAPKDLPVELQVRQSIRLGGMSILIDRPEQSASDGSATTVHSPLSPVHVPVPQDWTDGAPPRSAHRDASLLEAFCEGARLDASALSSQDPVELMKRVGAIYQQTILGLAALMADRARLKSDYQLERTTIGAADNNPFKWAPTRKLAQDLLCGGDAGFLSDADAVRASFEDLGLHLAAVAQGANAAAELAVQTLAPEAIDAEARAQASLLRSRQAVCWEILNRRHAALTRGDEQQNGGLRRAFGEAYGRAMDAAH